MNDNISPKLIHCSLSRIGLAIKFLNLGDIDTFLKKAIDPPPTVAVKDAIVLLEGKIFNTNVNLICNSVLLQLFP